ncbi:MAG: FGGY-family carbohydrate kinase [Lachnospiraceae bacterium]|jgi:xylulokinase|nr:FGGY-family carbohydrate kinase [Lachnospiraceae bacterium]
MSVICIDIGTTRCKISTIRSDGQVLSECAFPHNAQLPRNKLDSELIFHAIDLELQRLFSQFNCIEAITASSFGETFICTDQRGTALAPGILYFDTRAKPQVEKLNSLLGEQTVYSHTGHRLHTVSPLAKLCWTKEHEAELIDDSFCFLFMADYILVRLGASPFMSKSFAVASNWMDYCAREQWSDALAAAEIPVQKLPSVQSAGTIVGHLSPTLCERYHCSTPPKLIAGGHDQPFATIGAGAYSPGDAVYGMGTSDSLNLILPEPMLTECAYQYGFYCEQYFDTPNYLTSAQLPSGGKSLTWAEQLLFSSSKDFSFEICKSHIGQAVTRKNDILFFPLINGSGTPFSLTPLSGSFWGLTAQATPYDLLLSVLEGVAFEMKFNLELLHRCNMDCRHIIASGGGAQFDDWLQLRSDILGLPLWISGSKNTGVSGLFALCAVTLGYFDTLQEAVQSTNPVCGVKNPCFSESDYYTKKYQQYRELRTFIQNRSLKN